MTAVAEGGAPSAAERRLLEVWARPRGLAAISEVNNTYIGQYYLVTGFAFFLAAGVLALLMRIQLAVPDNTFLNAELYNQMFTMHGTTMMFLFAVPILEGAAIYLMPQMLGARDLPFPRLGAYGYWCYLLGGLLVFGSLFIGAAPDGGWFMYTPLTNPVHSPGIGADIWLLGLVFVEISAISAAIEIIVGVLKTRAPGMQIHRMPLFAWYMLVVAVMIVFAFPPLIVGDLLLEIERAFGWPFFDPGRGGDPLLWQHLFWIFGHPEVYIIFLPAAGMVSMIVQTFARRPFVGYGWAVVAAVGTGFISFALWVHHMYATGIPQLSLSFFSAASAAVAIPAGIQVFAWIATLLLGRPLLRTPLLFVLGFLFIFVLGGLTGVMVALVPFDWQVHDSYFVVAHFHYVLIGGMVFPLFAGIYYWTPYATGRLLSERLGAAAFWLMFLGFNIAFFPMHVTGLMGMPRRVYTYPEALGWGALNMVSTLGAFVFAAAVLVVVVDFARHLLRGPPAPQNPWNAATLEWLGPLPGRNWGVRSVPLVEARDPLWDQPRLAAEVGQGRHFLGDAASMRRQTLITTVVDARPAQLLDLPGPSWLPLLAAITSALFFVLALTEDYALAVGAGGLTIALFVVWLWDTAHKPAAESADIGKGVRVPTYVTGSDSHAWWAVFVTVLVDASAFAALVFSHLFLWTITAASGPYPAQETTALPLAGAAALLLLVAGLAMRLAVRGNLRGGGVQLALGLIAAMVAAAAVIAVQAHFLLESPASPTAHAYGATMYAIVGFHAFHMAIALLMGGYTMARALAGHVHQHRDMALRNTALFWHYAVVQGLVALVVVHLLPLAA